MKRRIRKAFQFLKPQNLPQLLLILLHTFFFICFEILLVSVYSSLLFLGWTEYLLWQFLSISMYLMNIYLSWKSAVFRFLVFIGCIIISVISLGFLYNIILLQALKMSLWLLLGISIIGLILNFKYYRKENLDFNFKPDGILILFLLSSIALNISLLTVPKRMIEIEPKTEPELIFFIQPTQLPNDQATYDAWGENKISFMPSMGLWVLNSSSVMNRIKLAINNSCNLYINLIPSPSDFGHIGNTGDYLNVYEEFRDWFINESVFDSPYIKAFTIDAEPPIDRLEKIDEGDIFNGINYLLKQFPSEEEIEKATANLQELVQKIRSDGKKAGIIRTRRYLDETDGDGDLELINRNVYSLDVEWDFSVNMLYRSQAIKESEEGSAQDIATDTLVEIFGGSKTDGAYVYSRFFFYLFVGIEQTKSELDTNDQYIFLGNYKAKFEETDYIKDEEFLYDLDICRHFSEKKVFLYNYEGFTYHYGEEGLKELFEHNQQKDSWVLEVGSLETELNIIFLIFLNFIDRVLQLDPTTNNLAWEIH